MVAGAVTADSIDDFVICELIRRVSVILLECRYAQPQGTKLAMIPGKSSGPIVVVAAFTLGVTLGGASPAGNNEKPKLSLKANPAITFSPANIFFVAEVKGGPDDYEELYCPSVEWEWGDGTKDQSSSDCDPYEPGKSQIKRRYVAQKRYQSAADYRVLFRLKQKDRVVGSASTQLKIRPGLRDPIGS
jgi:hypothetical protein